MATVPPASSQAGTQPESQKEPKSQPENYPDTGIELEAALPVAAPTAASDATSRAKQKKQDKAKRGVEPESHGPVSSLRVTPLAGPPSAVTPLIIAGVDEAAESSASHLGGSSAMDIKLV